MIDFKTLLVKPQPDRDPKPWRRGIQRDHYKGYHEALNDLSFMYTYYRGEVFEEWLRGIKLYYQAHGSSLINALGSPYKDKPGLADNVDTGKRFLQNAYFVGLIDRHALQPTPEQQFFDCNRSFHHTPMLAWEGYWYTLTKSGLEALNAKA